MSFPLVIVGHLSILLLSFFSKKHKNILLPVAMLVLGGVFLSRTYQINSSPAVENSEIKGFKVMNYNVSGFQHDARAKKEQVNVEKKNMKEWVTSTGVDILCMAEYININGSGSLNVTNLLEKEGLKYVKYFNESEFNRPHSYWGMALFSKYPIVSSKDTVFEMQNGMIRADIKIGKDTIRVVSVHFYSMALKLKTLAAQRTLDGIIKEGTWTARMIKQGFSSHASELGALTSWVNSSPYPVIVCGDFNETPYGYVYGKTRSMLQSAFEKKGRGFGFTFNEAPYFIRIDHQFYDQSKLELVDFKTLRSVRYSDHYPLLGTYRVIEGMEKE